MDLFNTAELNDAKIKVNPNHLQPNCKKCDLNKAPKIEVSGEGKKEILVIGESTLNEEMTYGSAFVDDTGFLLNKILRKQNISLNKDCWKINAVKCYSHIKTNHKQINCCRPALEKLIYKLKPKTILLCGDVAVTSLFGEDFSNRSIFRWRMYCIPDEKYKCNIIPILHPRYVLDNDKDSGMYRQYERDVTKACYLMKRPFLKNKKYESYVTVVTDFTKLKRILTKVIKNKTKIAYDYETTGLKPYRNRQKIVTIAFAVSMTKAFAFPFDYKTFWTEKERNEIYTLWQTILRDDKINKIAYNEKFEKIWSMEIFKAKPKCFFDPMIVLHILDNRSGILGLKFQTFVNYGVRPYDKHIQKYLKAKKASDYNSVEEAPFNDLLIYNGLDCIFTYMLYDELMGKLGKNSELLSAYNFFIRGLDIMAIMQHNGIPASADYYEQTDVYLHEKIQKLETELMTGREATKFKEKYKRDIKIKSNQDLGKLFYEVLGKPAIKTSKGNYKTDKPTLETLKLPFVDKLLDIKKYEKAKGTYLGQFKREIVSNKIHPFFNLHLPVSYRSSASSPSFQNIPKRDPEISNLVRKGLFAPKNCVISETDFSGSEIIGSASCHRDPNFIHYLQNPETDMHRDIAEDIWQLPKDMLNDPNYNKEQKKKAKMIRFFAKNNWTFAQFYGDWFLPCGTNLWENVINGNLELPTGQSVLDYTNEKGIYELGEIIQGVVTPGSFLDHLKKVEKKMWYDRFPQYTQWKNDIYEQYQDYGYIENHFGFRFTGYMSKNQCCNYPIQSVSFHLLLDSLIVLYKSLRKHKMKTKLIGQIHDSCLAIVPENEIVTYHTIVHDIIANLHNKFKWMVVPMDSEIEISKLGKNGGNFTEMSEISITDIQEGKYKAII